MSLLCPGFPGGRGEAGHPSAVRRRRHGGAADPGQAEHPHLRVAVLQLLQRATTQSVLGSGDRQFFLQHPCWPVKSGFPLVSVGGVKRPAEGSREEPSEKKNLPVVAKTFVPKAAENRPPPSVHLVAQTSTKVAGAAAQVTAHSNSHFL